MHQGLFGYLEGGKLPVRKIRWHIPVYCSKLLQLLLAECVCSHTLYVPMPEDA